MRAFFFFLTACEFNRSYSGQLKGLPQQVNSAFCRKQRSGFTSPSLNIQGAGARCSLHGHEDENGTRYLQYGWFILLLLRFFLLKMHYVWNADHYPLCYVSSSTLVP